MHQKRIRPWHVLACFSTLCWLFFVSPVLAAEEPPYEFDAYLSLTGGCGTSKADPIADPGCPEKKPPKPFSRLTAIAVDSHGYEYVVSFGTGGSPEGSEGRIDVFSPEGIFVTEISDPFGPRSVAIDGKGNLYVYDKRPGFDAEVARYSPSIYKPEEGKIEYKNPRVVIENFPSSPYGAVAVDRFNDHVFVSTAATIIREYSSAESGNEPIGTITERLFSNTFVTVDAQRRRLYASSCPDGDITKCWVLVFDADSPHELLEEVKGPNSPEGVFLSQKGWISTAVDEKTGNFFIGDLELSKNIYQFNENYERISTLTLDPALFEGGEALQIAASSAPESVSNHRYLFVPSLKNRALAFGPPAEPPAQVQSAAVIGIGEEEAELLATLEPKGGNATYVIEYTTQQAFEEKGFEGATVAREGTIAPAEQEAVISVAVNGLSPATAYRFRVRIENEAGGEEKQVSFTTYEDVPTVIGPCPNDALRVAFSTNLPDCRAYELVTPPDTNGRPPEGVKNIGDVFTTLEASPFGNALSFLTEGGTIPGVGGAGGFNGDPYRAIRTATGWSTESAGPSGAESVSPDPGSTSPDQGYSFWVATREGSAVVEGKDTRYVRYPDGHSELIGRGSLVTDPRAPGELITENGDHIVFRSTVQLESDAPPTGTIVVYDRIKNPAAPGGEETKVVSLLPGDVIPAAGQDSKYLGASDDGEGIAFSIGSTLYLRVNNEETFLAGTGVTFAGVAEGGSRIFYMEGGDLKALDTTVGEEGEEIAFTNLGNVTPVNVAKDGSRAYFVSTAALGDENPLGDLPVAGQRNLYLSEEGSISFVATVTARDVEGEIDSAIGAKIDGLGLWTTALELDGRFAIDPSRLSTDGAVMLFQSRANIDGYDPEGAPQIYRYDHSGERLHCVSCIPTKTPATGGASIQSYKSAKHPFAPFVWFGFVPSLTPDGNRAFFESIEALVSSDTDEVQDVYEWEEAGVGSCTKPGGCIYLITSGQSTENNYLYAMSRSGDDVFFTTSDILTGNDEDALSIYDARVNGGFPEQPEIICGEAGDCQPAPSPSPAFPTPASEASAAAPSPVTLRGSCPKGKRKVKRGGKIACVKKKKQRKHRKATSNKKGASK